MRLYYAIVLDLSKQSVLDLNWHQECTQFSFMIN